MFNLQDGKLAIHTEDNMECEDHDVRACKYDLPEKFVTKN